MPEPTLVNAKDALTLEIDATGARRAQLFHQIVGNQDVSLNYSEWNPGGSNGPHTRTKQEVLLCLHGKGEVVVEGGATYTMEPFTLISIPAGVTHTHRNASNGVYIQVSLAADGSYAG
jgi:quercetin dioxygenase-like cupin family protein